MDDGVFSDDVDDVFSVGAGNMAWVSGIGHLMVTKKCTVQSEMDRLVLLCMVWL